MNTSNQSAERAKSVDLANKRLLRKAVVVVACFLFAYLFTFLIPDITRIIASVTEVVVPSIRSLRHRSSSLHERPYLLFGQLAPLVPILALYTAWNADVLARFGAGVPKSGRSRTENLLVIYLLFLPAIFGVVTYLALLEVTGAQASNTTGSLLSTLLLTTDAGLFAIGLLLFFGVVFGLALALMALWMPIAFFMFSPNSRGLK